MSHNPQGPASVHHTERRADGTRHDVQVTRRARRQRPEVGPACRRHLVEDCIVTPFPQAVETLGRQP